MNIGNGTDPANVTLVNEHLNDNPVSSSGEVASDREGEKLIVGTLNINDGATLDANLGVASVEIGPSTLTMGAGAMLDLNTGDDTLGLGSQVEEFYGLGDQTGDWTAFMDQVIDSSNPGFTFEPVWLSGDDRTVWEVASLGVVIPGDVNGDGSVNLQDIAPFEALLAGGTAANPDAADINGDGSVNLQDIAPFEQLLAGGAPGSGAVVTPEPTTLALLGLGGLAALRRRRQA
jgi:hypothetical protein